MRTKKNIVIAVMLCAVVFLSVGYAIFQTNLIITGVGNVTSLWKVEITNVESVITGDAVNLTTPSYGGTSASFYAGLKKPGDKIEYKITVSNTGTVDAVIDDVVINASGSGAIIYSVEDLQSDVKLAKQTSTTFSVITEFDKSATSIPADASKQINITIVTVQDTDQELTPGTPSFDQPLWLSNKILLDNDEQSDEGIDFNQISSDTNGKGLYYTSTNTENNLPTYYFRGAVDNNYIKFGKDSSGNDIIWRIVRINEDGSVRLITQDSVGTSAFNALYDDNAYVGYMYGLPETTTLYGDVREDGVLSAIDYQRIAAYSAGTYTFTEKEKLLADINQDGEVTKDDAELVRAIFSQEHPYNLDDYDNDERYNKTHANVQDSTIKTYLDEWYTNNLSSYSDYLADAGFCNDRSVASSTGILATTDTALGYGQNETHYGAAGRFLEFNAWQVKENAQPQFACPNESQDLFTTSNSSKGNKALINPIGLLTMDEVSYAGGVYNETTQNMYLFNQSSFLIMPPVTYSNGVANMFVCFADGISDDLVSEEYGVRPVINIRGDLVVTTGDGSATTPYEVALD